MNQVHLCDCMEFMKSVSDKHYELAIVDPPYGINAGKMTMGTGKHNFTQGKDWDSAIPNNEYFTELFRISKNQIVWGGNYFTGFLPTTPHWVLWDKLNPNLSFAEGELAWIRDGRNLRIFKYYSANVAKDGGKVHPCQKPVALYKWLLKNYAKPGDKIFDSHVGSGSIRIACHDMGFDFEGCEIDEDYWEAQEKRFCAHIAQPDLFCGGEIQSLVYSEETLF